MLSGGDGRHDDGLDGDHSGTLVAVAANLAAPACAVAASPATPKGTPIFMPGDPLTLRPEATKQSITCRQTTLNPVGVGMPASASAVRLSDGSGGGSSRGGTAVLAVASPATVAAMAAAAAVAAAAAAMREDDGSSDEDHRRSEEGPLPPDGLLSDARQQLGPFANQDWLPLHDILGGDDAAPWSPRHGRPQAVAPECMLGFHPSLEVLTMAALSPSAGGAHCCVMGTPVTGDRRLAASASCLQQPMWDSIPTQWQGWQQQGSLRDDTGGVLEGGHHLLQSRSAPMPYMAEAYDEQQGMAVQGSATWQGTAGATARPAKTLRLQAGSSTVFQGLGRVRGGVNGGGCDRAAPLLMQQPCNISNSPSLMQHPCNNNNNNNIMHLLHSLRHLEQGPSGADAPSWLDGGGRTGSWATPSIAPRGHFVFGAPGEYPLGGSASVAAGAAGEHRNVHPGAASGGPAGASHQSREAAATAGAVGASHQSRAGRQQDGGALLSQLYLIQAQTPAQGESGSGGLGCGVRGSCFGPDPMTAAEYHQQGWGGEGDELTPARLPIEPPHPHLFALSVGSQWDAPSFGALSGAMI